MKRVSSGENPTVKRLLKVINKPERFAPRYGVQAGEVIVEGPRVIEMALQAGIKITHVAVTEEFTGSNENTILLDRLLGLGVYTVVLEKNALKRLSQTVTPQGIIALCRVGASEMTELPDEPVVVVDRIQDPGNMGTLIRTTDAAGFKMAVVLKGSVSPYNPKSIRASAGSVFNLKIAFTTAEELLLLASSENRRVVGTDLNGDAGLYDYKPQGRELVVFGNETRGISEEIKRASEVLLRIPIYGKAESLNVGCSAAVFLYELRQRLSLG